MVKTKNKSFLEKITAPLFNVFYYKVVLMIMLIPTLIVYTIDFNYRILFVMLAWGAVICLYDLFTKRKFLRASGMLWLLGFLIVFALSVFVNFKNSFNLNFTNFGYNVIALVLLYPNTTNNDKNRILKEVSVINYIFIAMTTVLSTISLIMFVTLHAVAIEGTDTTYVVGWYHNRLFGLYANTGYMITTIGLALLVLQIVVLKTLNKRFTVWHKVFFIYTAISNFLSICLENAKGAFISFAAFIFVFVFFLLYRILTRKNYKAFKVWTVSILASVLSSVVFFGAVYSIRPVLAYVPGIYSDIMGVEHGDLDDILTNEGEIELDEDNKINIDRDISSSYGFLTGRPKIWKFGLKEFLKKPLIGHGPQSHREYHILDIGLRHFHNLIIQSLVSVGILGSIFIFVFFFKKLLKTFSLLLNKIVSDDKFILVGMTIFAVVAMFIVNSMSEVTVLFLARFSVFIFWILFGYMITLVSDDKKPKEDLWLEKIADSIDNKLKKKN